MLDRLELSILLDYYGELLTEKQRAIMNLYYNDDLSLSEIAEINNTSRQAIYDLIKRCYNQLENYEGKLALMKNDLEIANKKKEIMLLLNELENKDTNCKETILQIKNILNDI